ncbi:hypothetical protein HYE26_02070 [Mycoplasmopsis bovis]|nr:hypothetical protein [Mycoplasmopsis bovis]QQH23252.1 hypothetical protein HYE26_02070 [Mycoplasmopsis bovis]
MMSKRKLIIEQHLHTKATSLFLKFIDQFIIKLKLISDYNLDNQCLKRQHTALVFEANPSNFQNIKLTIISAPKI